MNHYEAMEVRKSRRSYLPDAIPAKKLRVLTDLIKLYNIRSGLSMELIQDGSAAFQGLHKSYGLFSGVRSIIALKSPSVLPHAKEKAGSFGELLVLEAIKLGLGTCWVGGTYDRHNGLFSLKDGEAVLCVIAVGVVPNEKTVHERIVYTLAHGRAKPLERLYESDGEPPAWFMAGVKAASLAPSAANAQPVRFTYRAGEAYAYVQDEGGHRMIDLGIAKTHFALAAEGNFALGNHGRFTRA